MRPIKLIGQDVILSMRRVRQAPEASPDLRGLVLWVVFGCVVTACALVVGGL